MKDSLDAPEILLPPELSLLSEFMRAEKEYRGDNSEFAERYNAYAGTHLSPKALKQMMNRSQRLLADELPHHNGIHRVIKLLEDQPDHHWDGKFQQLFPDDALRHIQVSASTRRVHPQSFLRNRLCNIFQYLV